MNADAGPTVPEWLAVVGAVVAAVGTYVPWIVAAPGADVVPQVYLSGMEWGVNSGDVLVLGVLAAGLAAAGYYRRERRGGYIVAGTGALVTLLTGVVLATSLGGFLGAFVPGVGAALTAAGGVLLVVAGQRHLATGVGHGGRADGADVSG